MPDQPGTRPQPPGAAVEAVPRVTGWYRSLYWRIAAGLFAFLALMLLAEGALFLWMTDRIAGSMPARSPRRLAELVASDMATAIAANSSLDLHTYVREQYGHVLQSFVVAMRDGRVVPNHDDVPEEVLDAARGEPGGRGFGRRPPGRPQGGAGGGGRGRGGPPEDGEPRPQRGFGPGPRRGPPRGEVAPIVVDAVPIGRVIVLSDSPPFSRVLRQMGPTMGLVAGSVLVVGTALIALLVFGPTRRRLRAVQAATERLGAGDLTARAPDYGGDEVAALAASFNRMADELGNRARALDASDQARRQLLADVSHELMTPLTAMRGYIETLAMPELRIDGPTRERYLGIVNEETHRLERIIGDLLDLARLEGGGTMLRRERVDVPALFARVKARHEREAASRGIELTQRVATGVELQGDPDRLEQALQNLAANALRHTPEGGVISLAAEPTPTGTRLIVRDTGSGIPDEHLALIFDRFYKADASRQAAPRPRAGQAAGSGLGLSIVKAIVEQHGGTITVRNDGGAIFEIVLPRADGHEGAGQVP